MEQEAQLTESQKDFNSILLQQCKDAEPLVKLQDEKITEGSINVIKEYLIINGFKNTKINLQIFAFNPDDNTEQKEGRVSTSKGVMYYYTDYITS
jgi:hypothetical protein